MATVLVTTQLLDGEGFFAESEQTPGCWGLGDTEIEALDDFCVALVGWIELGQRFGNDLPPMDWTYSA